MDFQKNSPPPILRFCILEILEAYIESEPDDRHLTNMHEGFIHVYTKFCQLDHKLFELGTATDQHKQRKAAARVAAAALRILTDFTVDKECVPCQKKNSTSSPSTPI